MPLNTLGSLSGSRSRSLPPYAIKRQPQNLQKVVNDPNPKFFVEVASRVAVNLNYQWKRGTSLLNLTNILNANSSSYSPQDDAVGVYYYQCEISSSIYSTIQTEIKTFIVSNFWTARNSERSYTAIAMSNDATIQTATATVPYTGDKIYVSTNSGVTWTARDSNRNWYGIAMSSNGVRQAAINRDGRIYLSTNSGTTWGSTIGFDRVWTSVAMNQDGSIIVATTNGSQGIPTSRVYISLNSGSTWTAKDPAIVNPTTQFEYDRNWNQASISADGTKIIVVGGAYEYSYSGGVFLSVNSGSTWTQILNLTGLSYIITQIKISRDGNLISYITNDKKVYKSTNSGVTWTSVNLVDPDGATNWWPSSISLSLDGSKQFISTFMINGQGYSDRSNILFKSSDYGNSWTKQYIEWPYTWTGSDISSDGSKQTIIAGRIFTSSDSSTRVNPATQIGESLEKSTSNDVADINNAGDRLILGNFRAPNNLFGWAKVYSWNGASWVQLGSDITELISNQTQDSSFGSGVAISGDGNTIGIYAYKYDTTARILTFSWDGEKWNKIGSTLNISGLPYGSVAYGGKIIFSSSGNKMAVQNYSVLGSVNAYSWSGSDWVQLGSTMSGGTVDSFAKDIAMNNLGDKIIIGDYLNDGGGTSGSKRGRVLIYSWNGSDWVQSILNGSTNNDSFGMKVSINGDGTKIVVASNAGIIRSYSWNGSAWIQIGSDINLSSLLPIDYDRYIDINDNGDKIAIGCPNADYSGFTTGVTKIYSLVSGNWVENAIDITSSIMQYSGKSAKFNSTGTVLLSMGNTLAKVYSLP
jgi:hypothetical protein